MSAENEEALRLAQTPRTDAKESRDKCLTAPWEDGAEGWHWVKAVPSDFARQLERELSALSAQAETLRGELETERMKLAACGVAADQNTEQSVKNHRLDADSPYRSGSYEQVCAAVDREMSLRVLLGGEQEMRRIQSRRAESAEAKLSAAEADLAKARKDVYAQQLLWTIEHHGTNDIGQSYTDFYGGHTEIQGGYPRWTRSWHEAVHFLREEDARDVAAAMSEYQFDGGQKTKWQAFDHLLNVEVTMKPIPQDKSHCFKHACTFPAHEGECPYCKIERIKREQDAALKGTR